MKNIYFLISIILVENVRMLTDMSARGLRNPIFSKRKWFKKMK